MNSAATTRAQVLVRHLRPNRVIAHPHEPLGANGGVVGEGPAAVARVSAQAGVPEVGAAMGQCSVVCARCVCSCPISPHAPPRRRPHR
jgi:hypothetical protein